MNCPFCNTPLREFANFPLTDEYTSSYIKHLGCPSTDCRINDFAIRYRCYIIDDKEIVYEDYILDNFYVQVSARFQSTSIYEIIKTTAATTTRDIVSVRKTIWLNYTNWQETLDKLKVCVIFS